MNDDLVSAVGATAELCGTNLSEAAAMLMVEDLAAFPRDQVLGALQKCRRELKGRLTVAEVISRLADGRPGVEEAWGMLPFDEATTVVWTDEMARAWGIAQPLIAMGDRVSARMVFKEAYIREVSDAREKAQPPAWTASLGHDPQGREGALKRAVELGRLPAAYAMKLIPGSAPTITVDTLIAMAHNRALLPKE